MNQQGAMLDTEQTATVTRLLSVAHGRPMPVIRCWNPLSTEPTQTRSLRMRLYDTGNNQAIAQQDDMGIMATLCGRATAAQERAPAPRPDAPQRLMDQVVDLIRKNETAVLRVHKTGSPEDKDADRYIAVGRRADGMAYLYNPDPRVGDYTLVFGRVGRNQPVEFTGQMLRYNERIRPDVDNAITSVTFLKHKA